jgi:hypothetical protein
MVVIISVYFFIQSDSELIPKTYSTGLIGCLYLKKILKDDTEKVCSLVIEDGFFVFSKFNILQTTTQCLTKAMVALVRKRVISCGTESPQMSYNLVKVSYTADCKV